jgi:hypothetical protein
LFDSHALLLLVLLRIGHLLATRCFSFILDTLHESARRHVHATQERVRSCGFKFIIATGWSLSYLLLHVVATVGCEFDSQTQVT